MIRIVGCAMVLGAVACQAPPREKNPMLSWTPTAPEAEARSRGLADVAVCGTTLVAVGDHGRVIRSLDSGRTWLEAENPVDETLAAVSFGQKEGQGWAVGRRGSILGTSDGGETWTVQRTDSKGEPLHDVVACGTDCAVAVGEHCEILRTHDGGAEWRTVLLGAGELRLNRVSRGPTGMLYVAGERGTLLKSADDGETWTQLRSPLSTTWYGVLPLGPKTLLAYGGDMAGRIFRTEDDGITWSAVPIARDFIFATVIRSRDGAILIEGYQDRWGAKELGAALRSVDQGRSFAPWRLEPEGLGLVRIAEAWDGTLVAAGPTGPTRLIQLSR